MGAVLWVVATVDTETLVAAVVPLDFGIDATCVAAIQVAVTARVDITVCALVRCKWRGRMGEVFTFVSEILRTRHSHDATKCAWVFHRGGNARERMLLSFYCCLLPGGRQADCIDEATFHDVYSFGV